VTPFSWLKAVPIAPEADHIHELLDRLKLVGGIGLLPEITNRITEERLRQFAREGHASDAVLDMADKLVGGFFAKARNTTCRRYAASAGKVGRLMHLSHGTINALVAAQAAKSDAFDAVDNAVGWPKSLSARGEVAELANLADEDPLVRAADRWKTLQASFSCAGLACLTFPAHLPGLRFPCSCRETLQQF
jgi:hypothetical protein